jgi:hypothetical protein
VLLILGPKFYFTKAHRCIADTNRERGDGDGDGDGDGEERGEKSKYKMIERQTERHILRCSERGDRKRGREREVERWRSKDGHTHTQTQLLREGKSERETYRVKESERGEDRWGD